MTPHKHLAHPLIILGLAASLIACAGPGPKPERQLQAAESAIKQAETADARQYNPVLLNQAINRVSDARELIEQEKYPEAERLLEKAAVDAELAGARSETEKTQRAVAEINSIIEDLRKQLEKQ